MQRSRKTILIAGGLMVFVMAGALLVYSGFGRGEAADTSPVPELLSQVPSDAPTLVYADLAAIRESAFYQHRPDRGPIAVPDREYADFVQSTGFNFEKDLDRVAIASWPSGLAPEKKQTVLIADGRFDRRKIHDYALRKGKLDRQAGHDVFLFPSDGVPAGEAFSGNPSTGNAPGVNAPAVKPHTGNAPGADSASAKQPNWNSVTFVNDHRIAIVEGASIAPLLGHQDIVAGGDSARDRAARVAGAAVIAITRVPAIPQNYSPGGVQSAQLLNLARSVQWITLAARPEGNDLRVSLEGECQSATGARQLQAALELFRLIGRAGLESPKTRQSMDPATLQVLESVLKSADVSASAERVRIQVELTPDIFNIGVTGKSK
ncbi:MAG: hypothetical protein LAO19_22265 [Acidobacteriia bacterium]|nr:hypothetical protein [Terriglobia bacterium]